MNAVPDWLPSLILLNDYGGDWSRYFAELYRAFQADFMAQSMSFQGMPLSCKRHPLIEGKEATFWHLISEGKIEAERTPDLRRCERIRWPRAIIEHAADPLVKMWENERKGEVRTLLWLESQEYLVVMANRPTYILIWTAYTVTQSHMKRKLRQEYEASRKG